LIENVSGGTFQLGSDALPADRLEYGIADMTVSGTVINLAALSIGTLDSSRSALAKVDTAIDRTSRERGSLGAVINRLQYTLNFTSNTLQNITNSESTVRDADYSIWASNLSRNQILRDTNLAAMTQARLVPQNLMSLLS
jgi:flagellin